MNDVLAMDIEILEFKKEPIFRSPSPVYPLFAGARPLSRSVMELPANNYLKSKEEIEAEFRFVASADREALLKKENPSATYGKIMKITEAGAQYTVIGLDLSGPLEENY